MRETLVDFPSPRAALLPCTSVRSTLTGSSILALRERGHFEKWKALVDPAARETLLFTPAGVWLPVATAMAHYDACERLGLSQDDVLGMGNAVARLTQQSVLSLALRLANESGTTPWTTLAYCPRLWARLYQGSAVGIWKVGPKDAELHVLGNPLAKFAYWRTALGGIVHSLVSPFAGKAYVREVRVRDAPDHPVLYRIAWA
jgi:hypothetical protein